MRCVVQRKSGSTRRSGGYREHQPALFAVQQFGSERASCVDASGSRARRFLPRPQDQGNLPPAAAGQPPDTYGTTLIKFLGSRGAAVAGAFFLTLIGGSTEAFGQ